jgi:hypothetical protein
LNATDVLSDFLDEFYSASRIHVSKAYYGNTGFRNLSIALPELLEIEARDVEQSQRECELSRQ